jgi:hypothetical protein
MVRGSRDRLGRYGEVGGNLERGTPMIVSLREEGAGERTPGPG